MIYLNCEGLMPVLFNGTEKKTLNFKEYNVVKVFRHEDKDSIAPLRGSGEDGYYAAYIFISILGSTTLLYKTYKIVQTVGHNLILEPSNYCPDFVRPVEIDDEVFWS